MRWCPVRASMKAVVPRWGREEMKVVMSRVGFGGRVSGGRLLWKVWVFGL